MISCNRIAAFTASRRSAISVASRHQHGIFTSTRLFSSVELSDNLASKLNDPSLLMDWKPLKPLSANDTDNSKFSVDDPATGKSIAQVASLHGLTKDMVDTSHEAFESGWRDTSASYRAGLLNEWNRLMLEPDTLQDLATIMTMEAGKPLKESEGEIRYAASFLEYYAGEAMRPSNGGFLVPTPFEHDDNKARGQILAKHQPVGVCAMITPWNFPAAMMTRKVGPALAAGCTAIVKPASLTPLSAIALSTLAERAGIPLEVVQLIISSSDGTKDVGAALCENALVRKISFTGSTNVGKWLLEKCAPTVKRISLELGGNAPFIVFEDADIDQAVTAAVASKFRNAGQTCVCADRFLVHFSVHDEFVEKMIEKTNSLQAGNGLDEGITLGPVISTSAIETIDEKVQQAQDMGATMALGGKPLSSLGPQFYEPTILTNVPLDADIWQEETFGPVAAIHKFDTDGQALEYANDSSVGLAGYFCTKDLQRAFQMADKLECGIVGVNEGVMSTCVAPFGGVKESGLGREGSPTGLAEYLETKYIFMNY